MIFPTLAGKPCGYVNLDHYYVNYWLPMHAMRLTKRRSPMLDADTCKTMVSRMQQARGLDWSYGGWLENRSRLWRGSYMEEGKKFLHLGVDFNAPPDTPVACDHNGIVLVVDNDHPEPQGWGTRVIILLDRAKVVLVFAHLKPSVSRVLKAGDTIKPGETFACVGNSSENGQWYPHVHVQAIPFSAYQHYKNNLSELDGYGALDNSSFYAREFPDPLNYVRLYD